MSVTATEVVTIDHPLLPLPSATEFKGFEETCPGAAGRILTLVEKQFEHRIDWEKKQQHEDNTSHTGGILVGFLVLVLFAIVAVIFGLCGLQTEAIVAMIAPMVAFAIAVLKYTSKR
jgi:uncharacterized membrane protein